MTCRSESSSSSRSSSSIGNKNVSRQVAVRSVARHGSSGNLYLGIDFGTTGSRAVVIEENGVIVGSSSCGWSQGDHEPPDSSASDSWLRALHSNLKALGPALCNNIRGVAIDGTSSTVLLVDGSTGECLPPAPKLYNEAQPQPALEYVASIAPEGHTVRAATSTLAKLVSWHQHGLLGSDRSQQVRLLHQADWLAGQLHGNWNATDWHNALKLGYDPAAEAYPPWLLSQDFAGALPMEVFRPGAPVAAVTAAAAAATGLPPDCLVCSGTTDSIAAFLAAGGAGAAEGALTPGIAVTSLGSTLAVKLLSAVRLEDSLTGVYSHRLGDLWLVGGASNSGGAVMRKYFTDSQLAELSQQINIDRSPQLNFYPLTQPGERFPVADPSMEPRLEPRPADDVDFLHGILEGIADVEAAAYQLLVRMGAPHVTQVFTAGGGAMNEPWMRMRGAKLGVPVKASANVDAAYGTALLCRDGLTMHR